MNNVVTEEVKMKLPSANTLSTWHHCHESAR